MELSVHVLCRPELAYGFAWAGVATQTVPDVPAATEALRHLARQGGAGVVLVEDALFQGLPPELLKRIDQRALPIVVPFPGPRWDQQSQAEEYVVEILRRAIGYRVRPR